MVVAISQLYQMWPITSQCYQASVSLVIRAPEKALKDLRKVRYLSLRGRVAHHDHTSYIEMHK